MAYDGKALVRTAVSYVSDTITISSSNYGTADAPATVETAGYFNGARAKLTVGDIIIASMGIGGTLKLKIYQVTAVPATGNVTIALQTVTAGRSPTGGVAFPPAGTFRPRVCHGGGFFIGGAHV